jgi:molybdopterin-guanine dinucleotide biosynthesis protein A
MPEFVVLLAADLPLLTVTAVRSLVGRLAGNTGTSRAAADDARADHVEAGQVEAGHARGGDRGGAGHLDGVVYLDDQGRRQPLCGAWRTAALGTAVDRLRLSRGGTLAGASMRALLAELTVAELPWTGTGAPPWFDCDTGDDVRRAERWTR